MQQHPLDRSQINEILQTQQANALAKQNAWEGYQQKCSESMLSEFIHVLKTSSQNSGEVELEDLDHCFVSSYEHGLVLRKIRHTFGSAIELSVDHPGTIAATLRWKLNPV